MAEESYIYSVYANNYATVRRHSPSEVQLVELLTAPSPTSYLQPHQQCRIKSIDHPPTILEIPSSLHAAHHHHLSLTFVRRPPDRDCLSTREKVSCDSS